MKIIICLAILSALLVSTACAAVNIGTFAGATPRLARRYCDPSSNDFKERHQWMLSSLAENRLVNGQLTNGWIQDLQTIIPSLPGLDYGIQVARYTWYQDNYFNQATCSENSVQAWPEQNADGSFFGFLIQEIELRIQLPFTQPNFGIGRGGEDNDDDDSRRLIESPALYNVSWKTPFIPQSALVQGLDLVEVALDDNNIAYSFADPVTKKSVLNEIITILSKNKLRSYSMNLPIEMVPGDDTTSFLVWNNIMSRAGPLPAPILDCFRKYYAGQLTKRPPPSCPTCPPVLVCPVPSVQARSMNIVPTSNNTFPFTIEGMREYVRNM